MNKKQEILKIFSLHIRELLSRLPLDFSKMQEVRMRIECPLMIVWDGQEYFVAAGGKVTKIAREGEIVTRKDLVETVGYMADYSLYAFEEELRQGFLTVQGGHRIGIAGKMVMDGDKIQSIRHISFLNVRFSHQICGCADEVLPYLIKDQEVCHTLIISPPRCGKTTLLRDLIRQISNGTSWFPGCTVGVVDERSEIGGSYLGVPQNDLGIRTDVLDCCPKAEGMMMLIRSMSPVVVAVDEIGGKNDIAALESVIHCGCKILCTVHGSSIDDVRKKPLLQKLVQDRVFERYVVLCNQKNIGKIHQIFDERGTNIFHSPEIENCGYSSET
ncbi:MAG: stage III sporulation protein AA [Muricoprocola sp.]